MVLSGRYYENLGRAISAGSQLEYELACVVILMGGAPGVVDAFDITRQTGEARRRIVSVARQAAADDHQYAAELQRLADQVEDALRRRHEVVHSLPVLDGRRPSLVDPRNSSVVQPADEDAVWRLAIELEALSVRALALQNDLVDHSSAPHGDMGD